MAYSSWLRIRILKQYPNWISTKKSKKRRAANIRCIKGYGQSKWHTSESDCMLSPSQTHIAIVCSIFRLGPREIIINTSEPKNEEILHTLGNILIQVIMISLVLFFRRTFGHHVSCDFGGDAWGREGAGRMVDRLRRTMQYHHNDSIISITEKWLTNWGVRACVCSPVAGWTIWEANLIMLVELVHLTLWSTRRYRRPVRVQWVGLHMLAIWIMD